MWYLHSLCKIPGSLCFSRSNRRMSNEEASSEEDDSQINAANGRGETNESRIDRFYVSALLADRGGKITIMANTTMSDHRPVVLTINSKRALKAWLLRIPESVLLDDKYAAEVERIWCNEVQEALSPAEGVATAISAISNFFKKQVMQHVYESIECIKRLKNVLASLQRLGERKPCSYWIQSNVTVVTCELRALQDKLYNYKFHKDASAWIAKGDRVTKEFVKVSGPKHVHTRVRHLLDANGDMTSDPEEMGLIATNFYHRLLSVDDPTFETSCCREQVWNHIRQVVSTQMNAQLIGPLTGEELRYAIQSLPHNICPGEDNLTPAFFLKYWELMENNLVLAFPQMLLEGSMPSSIAKGMIFLIPKGDGQYEDIPITPLNTIYKILVTTLQ